MPFNRLQFLQLVILMIAVPAQYMISEWYGCKSETERSKSVHLMLSSLNTFRKNYLSIYKWKNWLRTILSTTLAKYRKNVEGTVKKKSSTRHGQQQQGECVAKEVFYHNSPQGYFSTSVTVRSPRPKNVQYRVGQVIVHKIHGYRGVIIGWDETCKAPLTWIQAMHGSDQEIIKQPYYSVLVDTRDKRQQTTYVAQENIIIRTNLKVFHPNVWDYFNLYDGAQYHMRPAMQELYPHD